MHESCIDRIFINIKKKKKKYVSPLPREFLLATRRSQPEASFSPVVFVIVVSVKRNFLRPARDPRHGNNRQRFISYMVSIAGRIWHGIICMRRIELPQRVNNIRELHAARSVRGARLARSCNEISLAVCNIYLYTRVSMSTCTHGSVYMYTRVCIRCLNLNRQEGRQGALIRGDNCTLALLSIGVHGTSNDRSGCRLYGPRDRSIPSRSRVTARGSGGNDRAASVERSAAARGFAKLNFLLGPSARCAM